MYKACIIGASGYTGAELIKIIKRHPQIELVSCYVSENSQYADKTVSQVHSELAHICDMSLSNLTPNILKQLKNKFDAIFLATPHEFSHDHLPSLLDGKAKVFDLSGAYRLSDTSVFENYYGFAHKQQRILEKSVYGLAEWYEHEIKGASVIALPGCYPTASLLALKPLLEAGILSKDSIPVINATSGVSGAGKKASATTSFYEVSLQAYGVLQHRHTPEIEQYAECPVIFTPHLGAFKRGILATVTAFTKKHVTLKDIQNAYQKAYSSKPFVRVNEGMPKLSQVTYSNFCDIGFAFDKHKNCVVVTSAIDNLVKGASGQAIQCFNINAGLEQTMGLL